MSWDWLYYFNRQQWNWNNHSTTKLHLHTRTHTPVFWGSLCEITFPRFPEYTSTHMHTHIQRLALKLHMWSNFNAVQIDTDTVTNHSLKMGSAWKWIKITSCVHEHEFGYILIISPGWTSFPFSRIIWILRTALFRWEWVGFSLHKRNRVLKHTH